MNPHAWERLKRLHALLLELPAEERAALIEAECAGDPAMRAELEALLAVQLELGDFLTTPVPFELEADEAEPESPRELAGFDVLGRIGRGAMGVVYRARDRELQRIVALKVLPPRLTLEQRDIDRFRREARAVARLRHPGIVAIHSVGVEGEVHYFSMELVDGHDLGEEVRRQRELRDAARPTLLPREQAAYVAAVARVVADAADALDHAHEHGIVHRDVKPSNLLLTSDLQVKVADFGLARDDVQGRASRSGEVCGTPYYMSPEQAAFARHLVDRRTDVYSLGVVLYELLTLRKPFTGRSDLEIISRILRTEPPSPRRVRPELPRELEVICEKAMAKDLGERYPDARALRDDLRRYLAGRPIVARGLSAPERVLRWAKRQRTWLAAAALVLLLIAAAVAWTRAAERRRAVGDLRAGLAAALEGVALDERSFGELADLRRRLASLRELRGVAGPVERELESRLFALRESWRSAGQADLERSRDAGLPEGDRELARLRGLRTLLNAALLFPEDAELQRLGSIESALPRLDVEAVDARGRPVPARVSLRPVDLLDGVPGPARELGPAPLRDWPLEPGTYRVVVDFADGGRRELTRHLGPAHMHVQLVAARRDDEARVTAAGHGMVRFESTQYTYPQTDGEFDPRQGRSVPLGAFWLDRCEVTNGEYKSFLAAHPERSPPRHWKHWPDWRRDTALDELPVVGVTWTEARDYAEWAGKRLPTAAEWQYAARGSSGRTTPWTDAGDDAPLRGNVLADVPSSGASEAEDWQLYVTWARPVTSDPDACTPEGVHHLLGNVDEFTETVMLDRSGSELVPRLWDRLTYGGAWNAARLGWTLARTSYVGIGPMYEIHTRGFRCAKDAQPRSEEPR